jgi:hypothetical protein
MSIAAVLTNGFLIGLSSHYVEDNYINPLIPSTFTTPEARQAAVFAGRLAVVLVFEVTNDEYVYISMWFLD